ncbi:unnamed protein product [Larinioides sclopetarius]|uniref:Uncharacterized protein n=1 Tax=Larinioides sclopetarius TaxID=280406 RepID=A0AAV1ZRK1_9ARAC
MENICIKILQILPKLEPNTLDSLMKHLEDIGVAAENDLKFFFSDSLPMTSMPEVNVASPPTSAFW